MKKKVTAIVLCIAMLAIAIAGGTLAYFTDYDSVPNVVTVGNVSADLYESRYHRGGLGGYLEISGQPNPTSDADIIEDAENYYQSYLEATRLMPFDLKSEHRVQSMFEECTVAKNAYVKNTSTTNDCFVMVSYLIPKDIAPYLDLFYTGTQFVEDGDEILTKDARELNNTDKNEPMYTYVDSNGNNFVEQCGGYTTTYEGKEYYVADFIYMERLTPGEMTLYSPISKVTMVPTVTNEIMENLNLENRQFDIIVEAHVIQADGFYNALEAFEAYWQQGAENLPQA